uniref:Uncharacterized protein n=1 Tax=viral metagenome TaxID=1070528 RepID=A0A6C0H803_9ZZZZ
MNNQLFKIVRIIESLLTLLIYKYYCYFQRN